jgi:hypothetical protein
VGVDVEALISKGGTTAGSSTEEEKKAATPVLLRVPTDLLDRVDRRLSARAVKIPRHTWILEAIVEQLAREAS